MRILRHKAIIGYCLLVLGLGYAVHGNGEAINDSKERGQTTRGIICNILTQSDEQAIRLLPTEAKLLHIEPSILERFEKQQLKVTAGYRKQLAPSTPGLACDHGITTVKKLP